MLIIIVKKIYSLGLKLILRFFKNIEHLNYFYIIFYG